MAAAVLMLALLAAPSPAAAAEEDGRLPQGLAKRRSLLQAPLLPAAAPCFAFPSCGTPCEAPCFKVCFTRCVFFLNLAPAVCQRQCFTIDPLWCGN
uniref:Uncharacterized protein n=1 Tax=Oryza brachyantha TaxID=4533 RepID=J3N799_ORYBR